MAKDIINTLLRSKQTVFTFKDVMLFSEGEVSPALLRRRISYYVKKGDLIPIRRGIYAKDKDYDRFELANKIYTPSYISFETVLTRTGVNFQYYGQIFVASYLSRELEIGGQRYEYKKIKDEILTNLAGIISKDTYCIASPERAFLDRAYLSRHYHFDHLSALDWEKVFEILPIYENKELEKRVKMYYEDFKKNE